MTVLGMPIQTSWAVSGDLGAAFVGSSFVDLTSTIDVTAADLPEGAEDRYRQTVAWHKSGLNPGTVDLDVLRHKKSADGLSELFFDVEFRTDSSMSETIKGIFRQRDGYWLREVNFSAIDGDVKTATSRLAYLRDSNQINLSYSKNMGMTGQLVPEWHGRFDKMDELLGQTTKIVASADRVGEGNSEDLLARAGAGVQRDLIPGLPPGWVIAGSGMGHKPGESNHTWSEVGLLQPIFVGTPNETYLGIAYQYSDGFATQSSWTTSLFTPKDKWGLILGVQQAHDKTGEIGFMFMPPLLVLP